MKEAESVRVAVVVGVGAGLGAALGRRFARGYAVALVARGGEKLEAFAREVADAGGRIDGFYYCPHLPNASVEKYRTDCDCRKPKPGMIHSAARDLSLDVGGSYVVGDRWRVVAPDLPGHGRSANPA